MIDSKMIIDNKGMLDGVVAINSMKLIDGWGLLIIE